jgi:prepilin-type N-terminal cleavage/methylation domain-containing protein
MRSMRGTRGFSLVELLVALAMATVVAIAVFSAIFGSQRATTGMGQVIENRQNTRTAMQLIERDLRMAGSGWGRIDIQGAVSGSPMTLSPIMKSYGGSPTANDLITLLGGWDVVTSLSSSMANPSSNMNVTSVTGLAANDFVVITNSITAHIFQITSITGNRLDHTSASVYNTSGGHLNWPSGGYGAGTKVYRASWVTYAVVTSGARSQLMRQEKGQIAQVIADDVTQFKVTYLLDDDTEDRDPADMTSVERVEPSLLTKSAAKSVADSAYASVKPRSF